MPACLQVVNTITLVDQKNRARTANIYKTINDLLKLHLMMQIFC